MTFTPSSKDNTTYILTYITTGLVRIVSNAWPELDISETAEEEVHFNGTVRRGAALVKETHVRLLQMFWKGPVLALGVLDCQHLCLQWPACQKRTSIFEQQMYLTSKV